MSGSSGSGPFSIWRSISFEQFTEVSIQSGKGGFAQLFTVHEPKVVFKAHNATRAYDATVVSEIVLVSS